jgi:hypothetical protein
MSEAQYIKQNAQKSYQEPDSGAANAESQPQVNN